MFTGLVAELGTVRGLKRVQNSYHLTVAARKVLDNLKIGDSVAVNGVCLTVVVLGSGEFTADVMPETMRLSNLRDLRSGDRVNLERTPNTPPHSAISAISTREGAPSPQSLIHINRAGRVKIAPAATDSPAEPMVCTMLFSKMESLLRMTRITPMEITAAGMDADTVIPTRRPR